MQDRSSPRIVASRTEREPTLANGMRELRAGPRLNDLRSRSMAATSAQAGTTISTVTSVAKNQSIVVAKPCPPSSGGLFVVYRASKRHTPMTNPMMVTIASAARRAGVISL